MKTLITITLFLSVTLILGCGQNQKLTGRITFPDGQPLTAGTVIFQKENFISRSFVKPDGTYNAGSFKENDGIPPGMYKVYIIDALEMVNPEKDDSMRPLIAEEFTAPETTPLKIEIPGNKSFDITVEYPKTK